MDMKAIWIGGQSPYNGKLHLQLEHRDLNIIGKEMAETVQSKIFLYPGDAFLRPDFLKLVGLASQHHKELYVRTSGQLLLNPSYATAISKSGVKGLVFVVPAVRKDVHQWLLGPGWLKIMTKALTVAKNIGFEVFIELPFLRMNLDFFEESVLTLKSLGCRNFLFRFPVVHEFTDNDIIQMMPRYGLLESVLQKIPKWEEQYQIQCSVMNVPNCISQRQSSGIDSLNSKSCADCTSSCSKISSSYLKHFGWSEFRHPVTSESELNLFLNPQSTSRSLRQKMVQIARAKPTILNIVGDFSHKDIYELLREAQRLSIEQINYSGDLTLLKRLTDTQRIRLKPSTVAQHVHHLNDLTIMEAQWAELFSLFANSQFVLVFHVRSVQDVLSVQEWFQKGLCVASIAFYVHPEGHWSKLKESLTRLIPPIREPLVKVLPYCWHQEKIGNPLIPNWSGYQEQQSDGIMFWMNLPTQHCPKRAVCKASSICVGYIEGENTPTIIPLEEL